MRETTAAALGLLLMGACTLDVPLGTAADAGDGSDGLSPPSGACLAASPFRVDLDLVHQGEVGEGTLRISNACDAPVVLDGFTLSGDPGFSLTTDQGSWNVSPSTALQGVAFDIPWLVPAGGEVVATVSFAPSSAQAAYGVLLWRSQVFEAGSGLVVKLEANEALPCVATQPKSMDYGGKVLGEPVPRSVDVTSCGKGPLEISAASLVPDASGAQADVPFTHAPLDGPLPWILKPGETRQIEVTYVPVVLATWDEDGKPVRDRASLVLSTNAFEGEHSVALHGFGVLESCPEAVITSTGEALVPASTFLTFDGSQSSAPEGPIAHYAWTREGPDGSVQPLAAGTHAKSVEVEFATVGEHTIRLVVEDTSGAPSCAPAEAAVTVEASSGIHVELTWTTPGDPDPLDEGFEKGSDLDLHLLHPTAKGEDVNGDGSYDGWFDKPLDVFWDNLHPDWGNVGDPKAKDDPELLRDDVDSMGPEVIVLPEPEGGAVYRVGVHGWAEHGFGPSYATVRVWLAGEPNYTSEAVELHQGDLWSVGSILWPVDSIAPDEATFEPSGTEEEPEVIGGVDQSILSKP